MKRTLKQQIRNSACKKRGCHFTGFDLMKAKTFENDITRKRHSKSARADYQGV